jgi:hypothetical protein
MKKLSAAAKAKQQQCLNALSTLITKGLPIGIELIPDGDYIEVGVWCGSEEAFSAMIAVEKELRIDKGIWFDSGMDGEGRRDWMLDYCLEDKKVEA